MNDAWLDQLAPEHAPPPPGWWPPAPGWWLLAFLSLAFAVAAFLLWRNPRRRLRRATLRELNRIRARSDADVTAVAQAIQNLLRRYALAAFGAERVARLQGKQWLKFLDAHSDGAFVDSGESLLTSSYGAAARGATAVDPAAWFAAAEQFVRHASRKPPRASRRKRAAGAADAAAEGRSS